MLQPNSPPTGLSPAAKKLQHILDNKLPIAHQDEAIKEVLKVIKACSKEELDALGLRPPPVPALCMARCAAQQPLSTRLEAVQSFISSFQYNACTGYNYNCAKQRPLHAILATAALILTHSLPIKCIEAVFLGIMLTQGWGQLQRLPLGFKSRGSDGQVYRHIVLAVCDTTTGLFGSLGISRCSQLMDKPLQHSSLSSLVDDFHSAYRHVGHELLKVRVGLPVEHDPSWMGPVCWRFCSINMQRRSAQEAADLLDQHAAAAVDLARRFREAAAPACGDSRSVPQSPRGSPATPRSVNADPMAGGVLNKPRRQQQSQWRSPAASCCSSPTPPSPRARRLRAERQAAHSPADTSDDEAAAGAMNDSDSETNSIIQQLRHHHGGRRCGERGGQGRVCILGGISALTGL